MLRITFFLENNAKELGPALQYTKQGIITLTHKTTTNIYSDKRISEKSLKNVKP